MVMTAPSELVMWVANDRTTEGVVLVSGTAAMKAAGFWGVEVVRRALRPLRSRC
jgi:hypothetical protein